MTSTKPTDPSQYVLEELRHCYRRVEASHKHTDKLEYFSFVGLVGLGSVILSTQSDQQALALAVLASVACMFVLFRVLALEHYLGLVQRYIRKVEMADQNIDLFGAMERERREFYRNMRRLTWVAITITFVLFSLAIAYFGTFWSL